MEDGAIHDPPLFRGLGGGRGDFFSELLAVCVGDTLVCRGGALGDDIAAGTAVSTATETLTVWLSGCGGPGVTVLPRKQLSHIFCFCDLWMCASNSLFLLWSLHTRAPHFLQ